LAARPTAKKLAAEKAGVAVTDRGFINVDIQMRTRHQGQKRACSLGRRLAAPLPTAATKA